MIRNLINWLSVIIFLTAPSVLATSVDAEPDVTVRKILEKVNAVYGGQKLLNAKSIKLTDYNKGPWPGESENPGVPEIWRINEELTIDFVEQRKSLLSYRVPRTTIDLEKWIVEDGKGVVYDILHNKYEDREWVTYDWLGGSIIRSSDTMHAKTLLEEAKTLTPAGEEYYRGKRHYRLQRLDTMGRVFTYFIDAHSGLIRKIERAISGSGKVSYIFSNHHQRDGITYARDMNLFVNSDLRLVSVHRSIELNPDIKAAFTRPDNFTPWGDKTDSSQMVAKEIADNVYQAGQDFRLSVFFEQPEYFIAIGHANDLATNFDAVKTLTGSDKPLKYYLLTHHHRRSVAGLDKAIELGATLVVSAAHQEVVAETLGKDYSEEHIITVPKRGHYSLGDVTFFDIPTAHSKHYLVSYLKDQKLLFADEHYETELVSGRPRIFKDMVTFSEAINRLALDIDTLIDVSHWRRISMADFSKWTSEFTEKTCPEGYAICREG